MAKIIRRCVLIGLLVSGAGVQAEFQPEAIGQIKRLPSEYPAHWVMVHDFSFLHMLEGKVLVIDPLGETLADQYKGIMPAGFTAAFEYGAKRNEHYMIETFFSRGGRGGERTDVVTIYDPATLSVVDEIVIPPKRITGMPKTTMTGLVGERFLAVYNFTPAQSVSIVDLEARSFVGEVATAGCGFVLPNGKRSFTSICSNGSMLTSHLDAAGKLADSKKSAVLFDVQQDPIFETAVTVNGVAYFPTFTGQVLPIDVRGEEISAGATWSLAMNSGEQSWRPGGMNLIVADSANDGYVLMHPDGAEGTHKNGGSQVWVYDFAEQKRKRRIELTNWGLSLGTTGAADERLLLVTNDEMAIDVYRLPAGDYVKTLSVGAENPFLIHSTK